MEIKERRRIHLEATEGHPSMSIVVRAARSERRRLQRLVRKPKTPGLARRALAILRLMDGHSVAEVAGLVEAARSTVVDR